MCKKSIINRRWNDDALTSVRSRDAFLRGVRICDEDIDALGGGEVPAAQAHEHLFDDRLEQARDAEIMQVVFFHFPRVTHGRMAVADVERRR